MLFHPQKHLLALDFDGVIADSIRECLVSGYNAFQEYSGRGIKLEKFEELDPGWVAEARRLRNFIRSGEDYVYIALALERKEKIGNQVEFDRFLATNTSLQQQFFKAMYRERIRFSGEKPAGWANLNTLYHGMKTFLTNYPVKANLFIITTKKLTFVRKILDANQIALKKENLFDTSDNLSKSRIITGILKSHQTKPKDFFFVDDQVDTLMKVQSTAVNSVLAEWGYNNEEQIKRALENDLKVMNLESFYNFFNAKK